MGCSASPDATQSPRATASATEATSSAAPSASADTSADASSPTSEPSPSATAEEPPFLSRTKELSRFHAALHDLRFGRRKDHVRVMWLGDSHGAADFWSGTLRQLLGERFGSAGPGFVHLGYKDYRHDGIKLDIQGKWRMRPKGPADPTKKGDGIWGLGGIMMSGYADGPRVSLALTEPVPGKLVKYDVCYRLVEEGDALEVKVGSSKTRVSTQDTERGAVRHLTVEGAPDAKLNIEPVGRTDLCGVTVESDPTTNPGVVVDTVSINGARYKTALSWDETAWITEAKRRAPALVVFEYGTNEAGGVDPPFTKIRTHMAELLARVRRASPEADCVVVSPTDRADYGDNVAKIRMSLQTAAADQGCYFFDVWKELGGQGAAAKLRDEPTPRMQPDGIHLKPEAYRDLGRTMFEQLTHGYGAL